MRMGNDSRLRRFGVFLFWGAFLFEVIYLVFKRLDFDLPFEAWWLRAVAVCFGIKILCTKYTRREWIIICLFVLLGLVAFAVARRDLILRVVLMVVASKGIEQRKALFFVYVSLLTSYLINILLGIVGLKPWIDIRDYGRGGIETRYLFGFTHANMAHYSFWVFCAVGIVLYHKRMKWWMYILLEIMNLLLYRFTVSRTGMLVVSFTLLGILLLDYVPWNRFRVFMLIMGYPILLLLLFLSGIAISYGQEEKLQWLNRIFNNRILAAGMLGSISRPRLFDYATQIPGSETWIDFETLMTTTDIGYVRIMYVHGIAYGMIYVLVLGFLLWKCIVEARYTEGVFIISLMIYCFIEAVQMDCLYPTQCFVWLLLLNEWYQPLERGLCTRKQKAVG